MDIADYREQLERRLGKAREVMRVMINKAQRQPRRVVFPEGQEEKILRACQILIDEKIAVPILLGNEAVIREPWTGLRMHAGSIHLVDPEKESVNYAEELYRMRQRKGMTQREAAGMARNHTVFGSLMLRRGEADALIAGLTQHYPDTIRPALQVIRRARICAKYAASTS